jgi:hypothetical protein
MTQNQTGSTEQRLAVNVCYGIIGTLGIAILCRDLGVGPRPRAENKLNREVLFGEIEGKSLAPQSWRRGSRGSKVERRRVRDETPSRSSVSQKSRKAPTR